MEQGAGTQEAVPSEVPNRRHTKVAIVHRHPLFAESLCRVLLDAGVRSRSVEGPTPLHLEVDLRSMPTDVVIVVLGRNDEVPADVELVEKASTVLPGRVIVLADRQQRLQMAACMEAGAQQGLLTTEPLPKLMETLQCIAAGATELDGEDERQGLLAELRLHRSQQADVLVPFATLTSREADVLALLMLGMAAGEIAAESFVSVETVRSQIKAVLRKLEVKSALAAVAMAYRAGWSQASEEVALSA